MTTVATIRAIDPVQLSTELGDIGLSMSDDGTERIITCHDEAITQQALQAAVDAHEPAPPAPTPERRLQQQLDELTDLTMELLMGT